VLAVTNVFPVAYYPQIWRPDWSK